MIGTRDSSIAGAPYLASTALARRVFSPCGGATATAARANPYVVQAPSVLPAVATNTGTSQSPEFLITTARGTSDESGRIVAAAKLHANNMRRLKRHCALENPRDSSMHSNVRQVVAVQHEGSSGIPPARVDGDDGRTRSEKPLRISR
jgi:hypothetical protein